MDSNIIAFAIKAHHDTNHMYDGKPYSIHLALTVCYAQKYINLIPENYQNDIISACWLHDTIEDTRHSYNDIKNISNAYIADVVYAVTNEKGKTRKERANSKYYEGIKMVPFAKFVKMCDRLANVKYSVDTNSRMKEMYKKENEYFIKLLFSKDNVYETMINELNSLLQIN